MLYYLSFGIILGLTAGFSPGPLLTLVLSETLEHGVLSGIKIAIAPIITDAPIVIITLLVFTKLSGIDVVIGWISIFGGCYVLYMAYETGKRKELKVDHSGQAPKSLSKGVMTNFLSPHPYLFWFSVGAPTVISAGNISLLAAIIFFVGFYLLLIGSKVSLAFLVGKSRSFLKGRMYFFTMKLLSLTLIVFSMALFIDGFRLTGLSDSWSNLF